MMVSIVCAFLVSSWYLSLRAGSRSWLCGGPLGQRATLGRVVLVSGSGLHQVVVDCWVRRGLLAAAAGFVPKDAAGWCDATVRALLWRCCCRSRCLREGVYRAAAGFRCQLGAGAGRLLLSGCSSVGTTPGLGVRRRGWPPGCGRAAGHRLVRFHAGWRAAVADVAWRAGPVRLARWRAAGPGWDLPAGCG